MKIGDVIDVLQNFCLKFFSTSSDTLERTLEARIMLNLLRPAFFLECRLMVCQDLLFTAGPILTLQSFVPAFDFLDQGIPFFSLLFNGVERICRVPDDWLLKNKRPLLHGREVLREVLATWQARAKELPC